jgi:hypothetical protein
MCVPKRK